MKINKDLVEKLRNKEIAVKNDGTLEQLRQVLKEAFPFHNSVPNGNAIYYEARRENFWIGIYSINKPVVSVVEFFEDEDFKWGEAVEVSYNDKDWYPAIYGCKTPESNVLFKWGNIHCVFTPNASCWKFCRRQQVKEITLEEIAKKFNTTPDRIKIV